MARLSPLFLRPGDRLQQGAGRRCSRSITPNVPISHELHARDDRLRPLSGSATTSTSPAGIPIRSARSRARAASPERKLRYARQGDPDLQAFHHDLYRTVGKGRFWVMEQQPGPVNWARDNADPLPGMVRLWTWEAFAHGAEAVSYFRWRQAPFAQEQMHAGLLRPDDKPAPALAEARKVADEIEELDGGSRSPAGRLRHRLRLRERLGVGHPAACGGLQPFTTRRCGSTASSAGSASTSTSCRPPTTTFPATSSSSRRRSSPGRRADGGAVAHRRRRGDRPALRLQDQGLPYPGEPAPRPPLAAPRREGGARGDASRRPARRHQGRRPRRFAGATRSRPARRSSSRRRTAGRSSSAVRTSSISQRFSTTTRIFGSQDTSQ